MSSQMGSSLVDNSSPVVGIVTCIILDWLKNRVETSWFIMVYHHLPHFTGHFGASKPNFSVPFPWGTPCPTVRGVTIWPQGSPWDQKITRFFVWHLSYIYTFTKCYMVIDLNVLVRSWNVTMTWWSIIHGNFDQPSHTRTICQEFCKH